MGITGEAGSIGAPRWPAPRADRDAGDGCPHRVSADDRRGHETLARQRRAGIKPADQAWVRTEGRRARGILPSAGGRDRTAGALTGQAWLIGDLMRTWTRRRTE